MFYRRVLVHTIMTLMPQTHSKFYKLSTKIKAQATLIRRLKAIGFDSIRFDEKESGRIFVMAWHRNQNIKEAS
jgi:hypothetical protein